MRFFFLLLAIAAAACTQSAPAAATAASEQRLANLFFTPEGFTAPGKPLTAAPTDPSHGKLRLIVREQATGRSTACRINVIGADGNFYQPPDSDRLAPYALARAGNRTGKGPYRYLGWFFYSTGETTLDVPAGRVRVEVWKGLEHRPAIAQVDVKPGAVNELALDLERVAPMAEHGYSSGDLHLHLPRRDDADDALLFDLLAAEDVRHGGILGYNDPPGPYAGFMARFVAPQLRGLGRASVRSRGDVVLLSGQEYRTTTFGHLNLFWRDDLLLQGSDYNANNWPVYGLVGRETQQRGGFAIHAHGGYRQEIYADVALGAVDAVELLQFGIYRGVELADWYRFLNAGYRFPCIGASDYPLCRKLADCITYVRPAAEAAPAGDPPARDAFRRWLQGAADGRSFVTTGPLVLLEVNGQAPGEIIHARGAQRVSARVRVRCEVAPVQHVDLIVNGRVVQRLDAPEALARGQWLELKHELTLERSAWIAARAWSETREKNPVRVADSGWRGASVHLRAGYPDAEAHTNPVYVYLDGKAPYDEAALDAWVARIDEQRAAHAARAFPEKARVLAYFQNARDVLMKIRAAGGLAADADVRRLGGDLPPPTPAAARVTTDAARAADRALAQDGAVANPGEAELREFLRPTPAPSADEVTQRLEAVNGFRLELVAAEPLVVDPIAGAFDEDGNLYVCEMRDYPYKPRPGDAPLGAVRLLRDTDGDGRFDRATVFAEKLLWPAGVVPWKGGVFVAAAPDIWYLKDTDGDGVADLRRRVFTGFGTQGEQYMVNNLQFGLDHRIYGITAANGGTITAAEPLDEWMRSEQRLQPGRAVALQGSDFRFDPATGEFERVSGTIQFGNTFDDWGRRFTCSEARPVMHVVLPLEYLERNPHLPVATAITSVAPWPTPIFRISPVERWRHIRSSRRIAAGQRDANVSGASHHVVDGAAGVTVYRGGAYPKEYYGQVFTCDAQNNLIHRRALAPKGATFESRRVDEGTEFVRSPDQWFRPVNLLNAPDGTLYCLDMSREIIESVHVPLDVLPHLELTSGRDRGRIHRIAPPGFRSPPPPRLGRATAAQLVAALESPHGWWRDTASRLLRERQDRAVLPQLRDLARRSASPQARLHALWAMAGLGALDEDTLRAALADAEPGVRENAVRLAEPRLGESSALLDRTGALAADPDARVRFQVAFTLGETGDPRARAALTRLAMRGDNDTWTRTAILSSVAEFAPALFRDLAADAAFARSAGGETFLGLLAQMVGNRNEPGGIGQVLAAISRPELVQRSERAAKLLLHLGNGVKRAGRRLDSSLPALAQPPLRDVLAKARATALDPNAAATARTPAIELLGCLALAESRETLAALLAPAQPQLVQQAAVRVLSEYAEPETAAVLLGRWSEYLPATRMRVLQALLSREAHALAFLRAVEAGRATAAQLDPSRRALLLEHRNPEIRALAAKLLDRAASASRDAVIERYQAALKLPADAARGEKVFARACAACHRVDRTGNAIGPDLASSASLDAAALLVNILDPNRYLQPRYVLYVVEDRSGRSTSGMIASETASSLTLARPDGTTETLLRSDLAKLTSMGISLMPEGLEGAISLPEMADLLRFLGEAASRNRAPYDSLNRERDAGSRAGAVEPGARKPD